MIKGKGGFGLFSTPHKGRHRIERAESFYRKSTYFLGVLLVLHAISSYFYPWLITVHQPPDRMISSYSPIMEIPKHKAYAFAKDITQMLMLWPENAKKDFVDNMSKLQHYLTDDAKVSIYNFVNNPHEELGFWGDDRISSQRLSGLQRKLFPHQTEYYRESSVVSLDGGDTFVVYLDFVVEDTMLNSEIFEGTIRYPVIVRRWPVSYAKNEQGLAWGGLLGNPERIQHEKVTKNDTQNTFN